MTGWMRRRIERSRARCEKAATNNRPAREQEPGKQPKLDALAPQDNNEKSS